MASAAYRFFLSGAQLAGSGAAVDLSGSGHNATLDRAGDDAAVWANPGDITTISNGAPTASGLTVAGGYASFNWDNYPRDSFILAFSALITYPGWGSIIMGNRSAAGSGISISYSQTTPGALQIVLGDSSGTTYDTGALAVIAHASNPVRHDVVIIADGTTRTLMVWVDGVAQTLPNGGSYAALVATSVSGYPFALGYGGVSTVAGTAAARIRTVHGLILSGALGQIKNPAGLASLYRTNQRRKFPASLVGA